ncbi:MAG TPA: hypothetical protein VHH34_12825, partial [Pseudonocardiaceae bacterium]|nr:hypothetical protein [Pseudonocardiaceae bacterium]
EAIGADPELRLRTEQGAPIVLLLSYGAVGGVELPRAVADRTGATVWAATSYVALVDAGSQGLRIASVTPKLPSSRQHVTIHGEWLRTEPGDAGPGGVRAGDRDGVPGHVQLLDGVIVWDTDIRTQPVIDRRDHRPRGRSTLKADDPARVLVPLLTGVKSYTGRRTWPSALWPFPVPFAGKPMPHVSDAANVYHADTHGSAGRVWVTLRDGQEVSVSGQEWGRYLMRRPSFRKLPASTAVVTWACSATVPPDRDLLERHPDLMSAAQDLAEATGRTVYAADGLVTQVIIGGRMLSNDVKRPGWRPGRWTRVHPKVTAEELERLAVRAGLHQGDGPVSEDERRRMGELLRVARDLDGEAAEPSARTLDALRWLDEVWREESGRRKDEMERLARDMDARDVELLRDGVRRRGWLHDFGPEALSTLYREVFGAGQGAAVNSAKLRHLVRMARAASGRGSEAALETLRRMKDGWPPPPYAADLAELAIVTGADTAAGLLRRSGANANPAHFVPVQTRDRMRGLLDTAERLFGPVQEPYAPEDIARLTGLR